MSSSPFLATSGWALLGFLPFGGGGAPSPQHDAAPSASATLRWDAAFAAADACGVGASSSARAGSPYREATPAEFICNAGLFVTPTGWVAGDTHGHVQRCLDPQVLPEEREISLFPRRGISVSNMLIWGSPFTSKQEYLQTFVPLVTGEEAPSTAGDPALYMQYGVELSGFHAAGLGHVIGLDVTSQEADFFLGLGCPYDDGSGDFAAPILDHFRGAPGAVTGYAHVVWPVLLTVARAPGGVGWNWEDPALPAYVGSGARCSTGLNMVFPPPHALSFQPFLAAFDAALGKVDFLETVDLEFDFGTVVGAGELEVRWFGLYYKLLGAGVRVGIGAGSDTDCYTPRCEPRVWVRAVPGAASIDYPEWLNGLAEGRATLAAGSNQFLDLTVEGAELGETLFVNSGGPPHGLEALATYTVVTDEPVDETLEILVDGAVVATRTLTAVGSGTYTLQFQFTPTESTWVTARTGSFGAHTAAVYVIVDGEPIVDCATAEYWTIFADYFNWLLDVASAGGFLEPFVGCSEAEIRAHVADGRRVFAALRDYDTPLPVGVTRLGSSTPSSRGPLGILTDGPMVAGGASRISVFNAPSDTPGFLIVGPRYLETPYTTPGGAGIHVTGKPHLKGLFLLPVFSDHAGLAEITFPVTVPAGETWYAQFYFPDPNGGAPGPDAASGCLRLDTQ